MSHDAWPTGGGPNPALNPAFSFTANAGMVSDEELEQMLDSGQSEVFVSNVSSHAGRPPLAGPAVLPQPWPFLTEGTQARRERICMPRVPEHGPGPALSQRAALKLSRNL